MKPMTPVKATMLAVANVANAMHITITCLELTPILIATSSPKLITFMSQECLIIRAVATRTIGSTIRMLSHVAVESPPKSQKTTARTAACSGAIN